MQLQENDLDQHPVAQQNALSGQVPIIDVSALLKDSSSRDAQPAIDQIARACKTWGFFQVVNHGIPAAQLDAVWKETHALFDLPPPQKQQIMRSRDNPWGFNNQELTKNQRDKKEIFDFTREHFDPIYRAENRWPAQLPQFQSTMTAHLQACTNLSLSLLEAFCLGLKLPAKSLHPHFLENHTGFVRLNYYPVEDPITGLGEPAPLPADLGIHHHSDAGGLTVLLQDEVSGLQVYRDGLWYDIPAVEGAMVINIGDMMQVWSNDIYTAPVHRVLAMETRERYSIPFFFNPAADCTISPLATLTDKATPSHYRPILWGDYRGRRSDGDFANYGTEVQISQYRTTEP